MVYKEHVLKKVMRHIFLSRRQDKGLTQNGLSEISNITRQFISQVESGKRQPSVQTLCNLATAYGLSISELFLEIDTLYSQFDEGPGPENHP
ncbi:helix-turn-helix domain-containing protein [Fibrobacter sp. UWEL]|uniref:helix-turn-helix domain-containing protein n=1 Tax=Fibrobacter sp. UWEL TaxID=1896209 RepID=UPI0009154409|nr:DNA-binding transcriptional regulator, XRE-family HTH domain [Fibrobacter sp. UWEL]